MRRLWLVPLLLVPLAAAQDATTLRFTATPDGFRVSGYAGLNPTVSLAPGERVVATLVVEDPAGASLRFGAPISRETPCCQREGESATSDEYVVSAIASSGTTYSSEVAPEKHTGRLLVREPVPEIRVLEPEAGSDVAGRVTMRVVVKAFVLEPYPASEQNVQGRGHVRYLLDGKEALGPSNRTSFTFALPDEPGAHLLRAELVNHDASPLSPPASAEVIVHRVRDPAPTADGAPSASPPARGIPAPGLAALALVLVSASLCRRRR